MGALNRAGPSPGPVQLLTPVGHYRARICWVQSQAGLWENFIILFLNSADSPG